MTMQVTNDETPPGADNANGDGTAAAATNSGESSATPPGQGQGEAGKGGEAEGKTDDAGKAGEAAKPEGDKPQGAPEKYEVPDGITIDDAHRDYIEGVARASGLTQEQFAAALPKWAELRQQEREFERGQWAEKSEAEFGKDFSSIRDNAKAALLAVEKERPGIREELEATNLGNHPMVLWLFNKFGEMSKPRDMHGNDAPARSNAKGDPATRLYGGTQKQ